MSDLSEHQIKHGLNKLYKVASKWGVSPSKAASILQYGETSNSFWNWVNADGFLKLYLEGRTVKERSLKELIENKGYDIDIKEYTCYECPDWRSCEYSFDAYNTCGDCLAMK